MYACTGRARLLANAEAQQLGQRAISRRRGGIVSVLDCCSYHGLDASEPASMGDHTDPGLFTVATATHPGLEVAKRGDPDAFLPAHARGFGECAFVVFPGDALFLKGAKSKYVRSVHLPVISKNFPSFTLQTVKDCGHWLHAENPTETIANIVAVWQEGRPTNGLRRNQRGAPPICARESCGHSI